MKKNDRSGIAGILITIINIPWAALGLGGLQRAAIWSCYAAVVISVFILSWAAYWPVKWRLTSSLTAVLVLGGGALGLDYYVRAPKGPKVEVRYSDIMGAGQIFLPPFSYTTFILDLAHFQSESTFVIRNKGNDNIVNPTFSAGTSPSDVFRCLDFPQFTDVRFGGCPTPDIEMPDMPPEKAPQQQLGGPPFPSPIGATRTGPAVALVPQLPNYRTVKIKYNIPAGMNSFKVEFRVKGQNLSVAIYHVIVIVRR